LLNVLKSTGIGQFIWKSDFSHCQIMACVY